MPKNKWELIDDYIDYHNEREFFESLTIQEQALYKCATIDTISFKIFVLNKRWLEFIKSL